jgi:uncharacterized protein (UPF0332 family)
MDDGPIYLTKAIESLATAESEFVHRYNSCANRCYYACFQAAIAALLWDGIRAKGDHWMHGYVQSQFAGVLVNRRHRYPAPFRTVLTDLEVLRHRADYGTDLITEIEARRGLRRGREFVEAIRQGGERQL